MWFWLNELLHSDFVKYLMKQIIIHLLKSIHTTIPLMNDSPGWIKEEPNFLEWALFMKWVYDLLTRNTMRKINSTWLKVPRLWQDCYAKDFFPTGYHFKCLLCHLYCWCTLIKIAFQVYSLPSVNSDFVSPSRCKKTTEYQVN